MVFQTRSIYILLIALSEMVCVGQSREIFIEKANYYAGIDKHDSAAYYQQAVLSNCGDCSDSMLLSMHIDLGNSLKNILLFDKAVLQYNEAETYLKPSTDPNKKAGLYLAKAELFRATENKKKALEYLNATTKLLDSINPKLQARYYGRRAAVCNEMLMDVEEGIRYSKMAYEIAVRENDLDIQATSLNELGYSYENLSRLKEAEQYYQRALDASKRDNDIPKYAHILLNLGRNYTLMHLFEKALQTTFEALETAKQNNLLTIERYAYTNLMFIYRDMGDFENAFNYCMLFHEAQLLELERIHNRDLMEVERKYDFQKQVNISEKANHRAALAENQFKSRTQQRNKFILFTGLLLVALSIIVILFIKNRSNALAIATKNIQLNQNLQQKDFLFQELNHRVKNNLTLLKSLLFLKANASDDENVKNVLTESQNRIQAIATVHQHLYDTEEITHINLKKYAKQLFTEVPNSYTNFDFTIEGDDVEVDMPRTILIGLTLNELLTNSLKYAYTKKKPLVVSLRLHRKPEGFDVFYEDNGPGISPDVNLENGGFGFRMIRILMTQLNTSMEYKKLPTGPLFNFSLTL